MKKQMKYADNRGIQMVGIIGDAEMDSNTITVKTLNSGDQQSMTLAQLMDQLSA